MSDLFPLHSVHTAHAQCADSFGALVCSRTFCGLSESLSFCSFFFNLKFLFCDIYYDIACYARALLNFGAVSLSLSLCAMSEQHTNYTETKLSCILIGSEV